MLLPSPLGYGEVIPLDTVRWLRSPPADSLPHFTGTSGWVPIGQAEAVLAHWHYPLAFWRPASQDQQFELVAVLGLEPNKNVFYQQGKWVSSLYIPSYFLCYPFCIVHKSVHGQQQKNPIICIEKSCISNDAEYGTALTEINSAGQTILAPQWQQQVIALGKYEEDRQQMLKLCAMLNDYGLLAPFSVEAQLGEGKKVQFDGMFRIDEAKLPYLNAHQYRNLMKHHGTGLIYAHLFSMQRFNDLLQYQRE